MTRVRGDDQILRERLLTVEQTPFAGWDFSYLVGRMEEDDLPWDFEALVAEALPASQALLDMDTEGHIRSHPAIGCTDGR